MKDDMPDLGELMLTIFAAPFLLVVKIVEILGRWRFYRIAYTPRIACVNCREPVWLVGLWRCRCGFTYKGHLLRVCPVCESVPVVVRCYECGVTTKLPEP